MTTVNKTFLSCLSKPIQSGQGREGGGCVFKVIIFAVPLFAQRLHTSPVKSWSYSDNANKPVLLMLSKTKTIKKKTFLLIEIKLIQNINIRKKIRNVTLATN